MLALGASCGPSRGPHEKHGACLKRRGGACRLQSHLKSGIRNHHKFHYRCMLLTLGVRPLKRDGAPVTGHTRLDAGG